MTDKNEHNDIRHMDNNLDRLLELGEPIPSMPEDLKNRIRSRLVHIAPELEKKSILSSRWTVLPLTAAAALVLLLLVPWKGSLNGSISWADVHKHFEQVRTVSFKVCTWIGNATGEQKMSCAKVYLKDPGLLRAEIEVSASEVMGVKPRVSRTYIFRQEPDQYNFLTLNHELHEADFETRLFTVENEREPRFNPFINNVSMSWEKMKEITEDKTRMVGEGEINGIPAIGFSFDIPLEDFYIPGGYLPVMEQTFGELWVNRMDGTPMLAEIEIKIDVNPTLTRKVHLQYTDFQWNIPLEESLFNPDVPEGWRLNEKLIETFDYKGNKLAPGVTLNSFASGQESMITTEDVVGIVQGTQISHIDLPTPDETIITIELSQEAAQRLHDYADTHADYFIRVKIDDELNAALALKTKYPNRLVFDLMGLYLPLSEVEERYFTSPTERN
jgi:outer membrane lipoprotein-sorting protein